MDIVSGLTRNLFLRPVLHSILMLSPVLPAPTASAWYRVV